MGKRPLSSHSCCVSISATTCVQQFKYSKKICDTGEVGRPGGFCLSRLSRHLVLAAPVREEQAVSTRPGQEAVGAEVLDEELDGWGQGGGGCWRG